MSSSAMTNRMVVTNELVKENFGVFISQCEYTGRMRTLPERIRWILETRHLSQSALSLKAGLSRSHVDGIIEKFEANPDAEVQLNTLKAIARAGEVSWKWLVTGIGSPTDLDDVDLAPTDTLARGSSPDLKVLRAPPRWCDLSNWTDLVVEAVKSLPDMEEWVWKKVAKEYPPDGAPITVETVVKAAKYIKGTVPSPVTPDPEKYADARDNRPKIEPKARPSQGKARKASKTMRV